MNEKYLYQNNKDINAKLNIWLAFPSIYSFSMSSLGYLTTFKSIDEMEEINAERICTDTKNTSIPPNLIDLIGFSISFDLDFLNVFKILEKYKFPIKREEREETAPLIFAGGPVITANPLPYSDFFDFLIIGDGESLNKEIVQICKENKDKKKSKTLEILSKIEGIYVPSLNQNEVKKVSCELSSCISTPILTEESFFKNTFIIEIARGCGQKCGFCMASYLNLPVRFVEYKNVIKEINFGLTHTNKIALLGALIAAHPNFKEICEHINLKKQENPDLELTISSLRVDSIEPELIKTLVACGQKHTTIAIEAGSERLRKVINKNLSNEQIFNAIKIAYKNGLKGFKIYAMVGLPTETQDDLKEMIELAKKIKKDFKGFGLSFSISTFVPKAHTPFQWCKREDIKSLEKKQNYLKKEFHKLGMKASFTSAKWDFYQSVLSRGDKSLGDFLLNVYKSGGNIGAFKTEYKKLKKQTSFFENELDLNSDLPWDFIKIYPYKTFLINEHKRLLNKA